MGVLSGYGVLEGRCLGVLSVGSLSALICSGAGKAWDGLMGVAVVRC